MAKIDITILNLFARYGLPFLIGYVILFHLWKPAYNLMKLKILTLALKSYWTKVYACNRKELEQLFAPLHEVAQEDEGRKETKLRVMEIGIGEGANFGFYPANCAVFGVDPMSAVEDKLRKNIVKHDGLELKSFAAVGAEDMSHIDDDSIDAVVCTLVLCSVENPQKVVSEVKRILRKGGIFVFWEHVHASNDKRVARLQWILNRVWCALFDGCHLMRKTSEVIQAAQFTTHDFSTITLPVLSVISTTLFGSATK